MVGSGQTLNVEYTSTVGDGVRYVLDTCPVASSCLKGADSTGVGGTEVLSWTHVGAETTSQVFLDHFDLSAGGPFELELDLQ